MIDHLSIGCSDINRAKDFYKKIFELFESKIIHESSECIGFKFSSGAALWIAPPLDNTQSYVASNSFHLCFRASSRDVVDKFYNLAIELGATCEGGPGIRDVYGPNYYAAYARDPEGNKIEAAIY